MDVFAAHLDLVRLIHDAATIAAGHNRSLRRIARARGSADRAMNEAAAEVEASMVELGVALQVLVRHANRLARHAERSPR
jgi:antirestriction protein ArdC